jgi:MoxR-like ATPase
MSETAKEDFSTDWINRLHAADYIASAELATMVHLARTFSRPLLLEGPAGVGKTALAYALAAALERELIRLQCYEGIEAQQALYDWNYHKQLVDLNNHKSVDVFSEDYILPRPLMKALQSNRGAVLLIDEVDRADEAFEALLLEFMADYQITVPEWQTVAARVVPVVILTSNRTRPLSDALRRRCLYYHFGWPEENHERQILNLHIPKLDPVLADQIIRAVGRLRTWGLVKPPGIAETIDWARAFASIDADWSKRWVERTLGCVVKDSLDLETVRSRIEELFSGPP